MNGRISPKDNRGFSLVEVIVAVALLSLMATAFVALLSGSYSDIFITGRKSDALYEAQKDIEYSFASGTSEEDDILTIEYEATVGVSSIDIPGKVIDAQKSYDGGSIALRAFIAKK